VARGGSIWAVYFDAGAALDFEEVKSRSDRKAVFHAIEKLGSAGPGLPAPHMKSLKGERDLFELRPRGGASAVRPIYARIGSTFVILAVAPDKRRLDRAIADARARLSRLHPKK
jgi:hypothetical protein